MKTVKTYGEPQAGFQETRDLAEAMRHSIRECLSMSFDGEVSYLIYTLVDCVGVEPFVTLLAHALQDRNMHLAWKASETESDALSEMQRIESGTCYLLARLLREFFGPFEASNEVLASMAGRESGGPS